MFIDSETNLSIGDPTASPFPDPSSIDRAALQASLGKRRRFGIASASGIRQVFDPTHGDERTTFVDGRNPKITIAGKLYVATIADAFLDWLATHRDDNAPESPLRIVVGLDTRPTGPAIADTIIRTLLAHGVHVQYVFVAPVTKVVAYARETADGFLYVSASHNPVGYNGLKLGLADGRTLPPDRAEAFIAAYEARLTDRANIERLIAGVNAVPSERVQDVFDRIPHHRREASTIYGRFCDAVVTGIGNPAEAAAYKATLRKKIRDLDLWIGLDPNGGARQDTKYLESWGFNVAEINSRPRVDMVHQLAPTPEATHAAQEELLRLRSEGKRILCFFVFDTDGDRRNVVLPVEDGSALVPGVQIIFALDVLRAVAHHACDTTMPTQGKTGVVVNGPTSALIERLAERFGFVLKRTETGEANVAHAGEALAAEGVDVVMMGEGSNGSAFTLDLLIREPIHTIGTIVNLISNPETLHYLVGRLDEDCGPSEWLLPDRIPFLLANLVRVLPPSSDTDLFTSAGERWGLPVPPDLFKATFDEVVERAWPSQQCKLTDGMAGKDKRVTFEFVNYERDKELRGRGNRQTGLGGYKIELFVHSTEGKRLVGWIWFRPSGTERGLTRRGASVAHWVNSPRMRKRVSDHQQQLDAWLAELLDETERRTVDKVLSASAPNDAARTTLEQAIAKAASS